MAFAAVPVSVIIYKISRPNKDGHPTAIEDWLTKVSDMNKEWAQKNHNNTAAIQQAAKDKHLFYNIERNTHIELSYPEYVTLSYLPLS